VIDCSLPGKKPKIIDASTAHPHGAPGWVFSFPELVDEAARSGHSRRARHIELPPQYRLH
jgi:hypothetical protein